MKKYCHYISNLERLKQHLLKMRKYVKRSGNRGAMKELEKLNDSFEEADLGKPLECWPGLCEGVLNLMRTFGADFHIQRAAQIQIQNGSENILQLADHEFYRKSGTLYYLESESLCRFLLETPVEDKACDQVLRWKSPIRVSLPVGFCEKNGVRPFQLVLVDKKSVTASQVFDTLAECDDFTSLCVVSTLSPADGAHLYQRFWPESGNFRIKNSLPNVERDATNKALNIAVNLRLYIDAFPECVLVGPPQQERLCEASLQCDHVFRVSESETFKSSPEAHWRSGHFRVLRAERFKRNPDGGFRVVYINPCLVGHKNEMTVVDAVDQILELNIT